ncbi:MAG: hypothetical protein ACRC6M_10840 [Microcystaceae cyanobacterium]
MLSFIIAILLPIATPDYSNSNSDDCSFDNHSDTCVEEREFIYFLEIA